MPYDISSATIISRERQHYLFSTTRSEDPGALTLALAHAKADALLPQIHEPALLITSDQVVVWQGTLSTGNHIVKVVNLATPGRSRIDLDAVVVN